MVEISDPGTASRPANLRWRKSRHSNPSGNCVELARLAVGKIAVRNSRHPCGPILIYPANTITALLAATKTGQFNLLQ